MDRDAVLELAGQYGVDLALTGHGADICRAALGTIDVDDPAPEPTPAEALGVYLAAVSVSIQSSLAIWHRLSSAGANGRSAK